MDKIINESKNMSEEEFMEFMDYKATKIDNLPKIAKHLIKNDLMMVDRIDNEESTCRVVILRG